VRKKAKKRPGRPSAVGGRVKLTTTLAPATVNWLRTIGVGSISGAIEDLVSDEIDRHPEEWEQHAKDHGWWDESMKRRNVK
jgi:hypothetical protein